MSDLFRFNCDARGTVAVKVRPESAARLGRCLQLQAVAADAMVQQAAALAANLAAQVHRWAEFRSTLRPYANGDVKALVLRAVALGWSEKWRTA